ncbi:AraC family transcriptional regulator [Pseudonocardia sp. MH-G8]|uniref:AraC family transcriptional regulator n=1 Tax=Pseudonocardia sp. MH-G8 TaxID=1854588 RepID=UPI000BA02957|nr:AraC family transcriptional regulator [Pseudonocardia sp. MH-G8]OZM77859.1 AraC family transcriptional regulator [Pseudonocardia sp. MH-G8]
MDSLDELRTLVRGRAVGAHQSVSVLDGVSLTVVEAPTPPVAAMTQPSFAVVAQGVKRTTLNGRHHDYQAGQYLVVTLDLPVTGQALEATAEDPLVVVSMTLTPAAVAPLLLEAPPAPRRRGRPGIAVSTAPQELLDPIVRLLRLLDRPDDLRVLAPGLRTEILWRLLTGDQGALVHQIGATDGSLAHISRSIRWIRRHYDEPVAIAELADLACMSPSTFHRHFRSATSMTPIQFRQQIRLHEARTLLATRDADVAEIGYRVGYESPSQFNREYRRAFGTSPGRDAEAMRTRTGR